jgi:hypothetical protein
MPLTQRYPPVRWQVRAVGNSPFKPATVAWSPTAGAIHNPPASVLHRHLGVSAGKTAPLRSAKGCICSGRIRSSGACSRSGTPPGREVVQATASGAGPSHLRSPRPRAGRAVDSLPWTPRVSIQPNKGFHKAFVLGHIPYLSGRRTWARGVHLLCIALPGLPPDPVGSMAACAATTSTRVNARRTTSVTGCFLPARHDSMGLGVSPLAARVRSDAAGQSDVAPRTPRALMRDQRKGEARSQVVRSMRAISVRGAEELRRRACRRCIPGTSRRTD